MTRRTTIIAVAVGVLLLALAYVRFQVLDVVTVSSGSMSPTVCSGDTLVLERVHGSTPVRRDDIVVFPSPTDGESAVKRVVAVAGQRVAIEDGQLLIDGNAVPEPYVDQASIDGVYFGTVTVPPDSVFVMGDHREISIDSRHYGSIAVQTISGRLLFSLWGSCDE
jgi:signal peptidase I